MSYRWIVAVAALVAVAYGIGRLFAGMLSAFADSAAFPVLVRLAVIAFLLLAAAAGAMAYAFRTNIVDWKRVHTEQRLWESGALGRAWLKRRKNVVDRKGW
jgi:hypothetical protein